MANTVIKTDKVLIHWFKDFKYPAVKPHIRIGRYVVDLDIETLSSRVKSLETAKEWDENFIPNSWKKL